jgi:transcriptional regulator with XRE-family HTH domain
MISSSYAPKKPFYTQMDDCQCAIECEFADSYSQPHSYRMETIGNRLDELMQAHPLYRGRGQSSLARNTGVPQPTINRILSNKSVPEMATVVKLAEAFDVTCEWLLTGRGPKFIADIEASMQFANVLRSGIPEESEREKFPNNVTNALQAVLSAFRTGANISSSDVRTIIWYALTPVESGNIAQNNDLAHSDHEKTIVERATEAMKRTGDDHVDRSKGGAKKRHQS